MAQLVGRAVDRDVRTLRLPLAALRVGAALDTIRGRLTGKRPKLTFDRARYIAHPDWSANVAPLMQLGIWRPEVAPEEGVAATAAWYREQGLL